MFIQKIIILAFERSFLFYAKHFFSFHFYVCIYDSFIYDSLERKL